MAKALQPTWVSVLEDVEPTGRKQFLTLFADGTQRVATLLEHHAGEHLAYFNHAGRTLVKWGCVAWMDCPEPMKKSERMKIMRKVEREVEAYRATLKFKKKEKKAKPAPWYPKVPLTGVKRKSKARAK